MEINGILRELERIHEDATFSAQTYFEAAKSSSFWGKSIVFIPSIAAAIAAFLVALDAPKQLTAVGAVASAVAATSSFLGSTRHAEYHLESAKEFTRVRHAARLEISLASPDVGSDNLEARLRKLRDEYDSIVSKTIPAPNRFFRRAQRRLNRGALAYEPNREDGDRTLFTA